MTAHDLLASLLWTPVTILCYLGGLGLRRLTRNNALANPALITMVLVAVLLLLTHTPYALYFRATWALTFLLAPATVALGIPLAKNFAHVRQSLRGVGLGLLAGSLTSMVSGVLLVRWLGGSKELALSMLPKAVTTPIAMSVALSPPSRCVRYSASCASRTAMPSGWRPARRAVASLRRKWRKWVMVRPPSPPLGLA